MSDIQVGGRTFITTAKAAKNIGYSKDYIGQLCRKGKLDCSIVSGSWYVSESALLKYNNEINGIQKDDFAIDKVNNSKSVQTTDGTFSYGGIEYISTARAAEITGYAQDYIGQLSRNGEIEAHKVGRLWFISEKSLLAHKKENDDLLIEAQVRASGVRENKQKVETKNNIRIEKKYAQEVNVTKSKIVNSRDLHFNVKYITETEYNLMPFSGNIENQKNNYPSNDIFEEKGISVHTVDVRNGMKNNKKESKTKMEIQKRSINNSISSISDEDQGNNSNVENNLLGPVLKMLMTLILLGGIVGAFLLLINTTRLKTTLFNPRLDIIFHKLPNLDGFLTNISNKYGSVLPGNTIEYTAK